MIHMAVIRENHIDLINIDSNQNQDVLYATNTAEDVLLRSTNPNLPVGSKTLKDLVDRFGKLAFLNTISRENLDENLQQTLTRIEDTLEELTYVPIEILSFTSESPLLMIGSSISTIKFSWTLNKTATSITITGPSLNEEIDPILTSKSFTFATPITKTTTFTLTVEDEKEGTMSKTTTVSFTNYVYYGKSDNQSTVDTSDGNFTAVLSDSKARTITVTAGEREYIYYLLPSRLGTPIFNVSGFDGGFIKVGDKINKENTAGFIEQYDVWRSANDNLGELTIKIR